MQAGFRAMQTHSIDEEAGCLDTRSSGFIASPPREKNLLLRSKDTRRWAPWTKDRSVTAQLQVEVLRQSRGTHPIATRWSLLNTSPLVDLQSHIQGSWLDQLEPWPCDPVKNFAFR